MESESEYSDCDCGSQIIETTIALHNHKLRILYTFGYFKNGVMHKLQDQIRFDTENLSKIYFPPTLGCPDNYP